MKVGIAGTGRMSAAIATRLLGLGHEVSVWNRTADKARALASAGAMLAATAAEFAGRSEMVITILSNAAAIDAVYHGANGLLSGNVEGKLFIEMSTVRPEVERTLAEKVKGKGAALIECPVGGTVGPARDGKLFGFVGVAVADVACAKHPAGSDVPPRRARRPALNCMTFFLLCRRTFPFTCPRGEGITIDGPVVQRCGIEIRAVRPHDCMDFRIDSDLGKQRRVTKGSEKLAAQHRRKVDVALQRVIKRNPKRIRTYYGNRDHSKNRMHHCVALLTQRLDRERTPTLLQPVPGGDQLVAMQFRPCLRQPALLLRQATCHEVNRLKGEDADIALVTHGNAANGVGRPPPQTCE